MELWELDAAGMAEAVRQGEITAEALAETCLDRLAVIGPALNAVVAIDRDGTLEAARMVDRARARGDRLGSLAGVPLAHKDMFHRAGRLSGYGRRPDGEIRPAATSPLFARLDAAGALDAARLHMAEIALSPTGRNLHHGPARNPWNLDHATGGSSSGAGAAVAARLVPASLGSDTGGSIRHPAAMCGVLGLKPTRGLLSLDGAMPLAPSLDCAGLLARSARDLALLLAILQGRDPGHASPASDLKGMTIAIPDGLYRSAASPGVLEAADASLAILTEAGATLLRTASPDVERLNHLSQRVLAREAASIHARELAAHPDGFSAEIRGRIEPGLSIPLEEYSEALRLRDAVRADWLAAAMGHADLVHMPTLPVTAPTLVEAADLAGGNVPPVNARITVNTRGINYLGLPALAVPCGFAGGLPVSFQLVGRPLSEATMIRAAGAYQSLTPWHGMIPPVSAPR